jgi:hypothetical protein
VTVLEVDVDSERVSLKLKSETVNDVIGNAAVRETSCDDIVVRQEGKPEVVSSGCPAGGPRRKARSDPVGRPRRVMEYVHTFDPCL